jgi:hypothetical protein
VSLQSATYDVRQTNKKSSNERIIFEINLSFISFNQFTTEVQELCNLLPALAAMDSTYLMSFVALVTLHIQLADCSNDMAPLLRVSLSTRPEFAQSPM